MKGTIYCLVLGLCLLGTSSALAGEHLANVVWTTDVFLGNEAGTDYIAEQLDLDIGQTQYYLTVNGVVTVTRGGSIPCTGTGFTTASNDFFLGMQCGILTVSVTIGGQNLNGTIDVYQGETEISSGTLTYVGMY